MDASDAGQAITWMAQARRSAAEFRGYRQAGFVVVAWGLAWVLGFGALQFAPKSAGWFWLSAWAGALSWTWTRPRQKGDGQAFATWGVIVSYVILLLLFVRADVRTMAAIASLTLSAGFSILGLWAGHRYLALGAAVAISLMIGWWLAPTWLFLVLALGGGGSLVVGGIWLRLP